MYNLDASAFYIAFVLLHEYFTQKAKLLPYTTELSLQTWSISFSEQSLRNDRTFFKTASLQVRFFAINDITSKRWTLSEGCKLTMFSTGVIGSLAALTALFTLYLPWGTALCTLYHVMRYCTVYTVPCHEVLHCVHCTMWGGPDKIVLVNISCSQALPQSSTSSGC